MIEIAGGIILAVILLILIPVVIGLAVAFGWVLLGAIAFGLFFYEFYVAAVICGILAALWGGAMCTNN